MDSEAVCVKMMSTADPHFVEQVLQVRMLCEESRESGTPSTVHIRAWPILAVLSRSHWALLMNGFGAMDAINAQMHQSGLW